MDGNYKIPQHIKEKLTVGFCKEFIKQLDRIFHMTISDIKKTYYNFYLYHETTVGWHDAFKVACKNCKMNDVFEYYNTLDWYDGDIFDSQFDELLCEFEIIEIGEQETT